MKNSDIDQMFIGALRANTGPLHIELLGGDHGSYTIPMLDKQLGFELSLAIQNYYRRRNKFMSNKLKELLARVPKETYDKVRKQMTCAYYFNGGDCSKGLPGTPCILEGCVAWRLHPDFEKKVNTCRDCTFCKQVEGHPRRFYCQMKAQKYHTGTKCFVRLKDVACEDFIKQDEI